MPPLNRSPRLTPREYLAFATLIAIGILVWACAIAASW